MRMQCCLKCIRELKIWINLSGSTFCNLRRRGGLLWAKVLFCFLFAWFTFALGGNCIVSMVN